MKRTVALLSLLFTMPAVFADDTDVAKCLQNLETIHRLAGVVELRRSLPGTLPFEYPADPWGNPYRVADAENGYRIIGAGSDGTFEEMTDSRSTQFSGTAGDVVFENGRLIRSNRNWLYSQAGAAGGGSSNALAALQRAEVDFAIMRVPAMQNLTGAKATAISMGLVAQYVEQNKTAPAPELSLDAWGTPLRIIANDGGKYRIVSAGSDTTFDEASWTRAPKADLAEDIVFENGKLVRHVPEADILSDTSTIRAAAVPQPPDQSLQGRGRWLPLTPDIKPPVISKPVNPVYPDEYRRARVEGIVILEAAVSETGDVENVAVIKSLAPGLDVAAVNAVRQWLFTPATREGQPVPALFNVTINFKLK